MRMERTFVLMMDEETYKLLARLAEQMYRSKASVIRLLIRQAAHNPIEGGPRDQSVAVEQVAPEAEEHNNC